MSTALQERQPSCPAPKPPPPPKPSGPSKFDEERAIEIACQGPSFPAEVLAALRNLLPPATAGR